VLIVNRGIFVYEEDGTFKEDEKLVNFLPNSPGQRFDVRVVYDPFVKRFVMSCFVGAAGNDFVQIGWSQAEDSMATDYTDLSEWEFNDANAFWDLSDACDGETVDGPVDQPSLGFDDTAWYSGGWVAENVDDFSVNTFYVFEKEIENGQVESFASLDFPGDNCVDSGADAPQVPGGTETARAVEHYDQPSHDVPGDNTTNRVPTPYWVGVIRAKGTAFCPIQRPHNIVRIYSIGDPLDDNNRTFHTVDIQIGCFDGKVTYQLPVKEGGTGTRGHG